MKIEHLTNTFTTFGSELFDQFATCSSFSIATALINPNGIDLLEQCLKKNKKLKTGHLLIGVYAYFNLQPDLMRLKTLSQKYPEKFRVNVSKDKNFHWKYYHFEKTSIHTSYVGSANFTSGGLGSNGELVLKMTERKDGGLTTTESLKKAFDSQWIKSCSISELRIDLYPEVTRPNPPKSVSKEFNKFFVEEKTNPVKKGQQPENAVVFYLKYDLSPATLKKIYGYKPSWEKDDLNFFVCNGKAHFDNCNRSNSLLILSRESRNSFKYEWANVTDTCDSIRTPDGRYFIAYKPIGRSKLIKDKHQQLLKEKFAIDVRAVKEAFYSKVLRRKQVKEMEGLLPQITERNNGSSENRRKHYK